MKILKRILYTIVGIMLAGSLAILVCALNPSLTEWLAGKVQQLQADPAQAAGDQSGIVPPGTTADSSSGRYVVPDSLPQTVPEEVSGRSGFQPVTSDSEKIGQQEADNLSEILATGDTGEGLSFSSEYYPYYAMLDETLQSLYRQVYANALNLNTAFTPVVAVTMEQANNVVEAVYNDHPELFWLDAQFSCKYLKTGICVEIQLKYNETADDLEGAKQIFDTRVNEILTQGADAETDYDKERFVHDALMQIVEYDAQAKLNQSAYSAIVLGKSVCAGYARAFQYLMQQLQIPCYYCTGFAGQDHAWNIVKIGSLYRNVDVTWDDTEPATYNYYNKSDSEYSATHARTGLSIYLPACEDVMIDGQEQTSVDSVVDDHINPDPQEPLEWHEPEKTEEEKAAEAARTAEQERQEKLRKAGIREDEVCDTLDAYFKDCANQLKQVGLGDRQFYNIIPEELWGGVERAYSSGTYWKDYAEAALEDMGGENLVIQIEAQRLGGGYYIVYHNVYSY